MDTSDPDIAFDEKGVCNHCHQAKAMVEEAKLRRNDLPWVIYEMKKAGRGKQYDCLLGLSGGVDSSMCLHLLLEQGLRPLTFSIDNGWNTVAADENIMNLVEGLKVPFYRYTIDTELFKKLQMAFIRSGTPNIEIPTDHILMAATYELASKYGIKWIISGGNVATESIMPKAWGYNARDSSFVKSVFKTFYPGLSLKTLPTIGITEYLWCRFVKGIKVVNLLDYYEYNRAKAKQLLWSLYGWKDYGEKHAENHYTRWFQNMYLPERFGYDKRRAHLSSEINSGQLTREVAILELKKKPEKTSITFGHHVDHSVMEDVPKKTHRDFVNNENLWDRLSKTYAYIK